MMVFSETFIALIMAWIAVFTYFIAAASQALTNHKLKSTEGLSDSFILFYLNTYILMMYYIFCLDLPMPYRIMEPLTGLMIVTMVFQRLWYNPRERSKHMYPYLMISSGIALFFAILSRTNPEALGHISGWGSCFFDTVTLIPQIIKMHRTKSVEGFSFLFATAIAIANSVEVAASIYNNTIPFQTVVMGLKGVIIYAICVIQFFIYSRKKTPTHHKK